MLSQYREGEKLLPAIKDMDPLEMQQLYYLIRNPTEVALQFRAGEWVDWVFALKQLGGRRHLLEFV